MTNPFTDTITADGYIIAASGYSTIFLQNQGTGNAYVIGSSTGSNPTLIMPNGGTWGVFNVPSGIGEITINANGTSVGITAY